MNELILIAAMLATSPAQAYCYNTPSGMTVCPPIDDHVGVERDTSADAKQACPQDSDLANSPACHDEAQPEKPH